jgi:hypothetical protein
MKTKQNIKNLFSHKLFATAIILMTSLLSLGQIKNTEPTSLKKNTTFLLPDEKVFTLKNWTA